MKSGVIATVNTDAPIESSQNVVNLDTNPNIDQLNQSVQVRQTLNLNNGRTAQIGRAAIEDIKERDQVQIRESGEIIVREIEEPSIKYTEFIFVPGEFMVVSNNSGKFLFSLLNSQKEHDISQVEIDLNSFVEDHKYAKTWKVGFHERGANAENGVMHGDGLFEDRELGKVLNSSKKNQVGIEFNLGGDLIKMLVTESGYIEIYQPSNYDTKDFVSFIDNQITDHLRVK